MTGPKVPFVDLSIQWDQIQDEVMPDLARLFQASAFCLGPWATAFEAQIAEYLGVKHAIAVNSGSAALHVATIAAGIGRGDKVLVPAHTFIGTIWGLLYEGAIPVFCDVEDTTGNIDLADAERRMEPGVKAIIPVHLYGQPVDVTGVLAFAERHGLTVIEDAAQAIGAQWQGKAIGTFGAMGCFSFYPGKNLGGAGEGGLIVTDDDEKARLARILREHGQSERYVHERIGYNYRMDGIQALVLSHKLKRLDGWTGQRRAIARRYEDALADTPLRLPAVVHGDHVHHLYVVRTAERDALRTFLDEQGVQTGLHYPVPLYRQPCLAGIATPPADGFPVTEDWAGNGLSLPMFAGMTQAQQDCVIAAIHAYFEKRAL
ncbi:DegT/DnrJ/EryC1/StrS family aminotransferase [Novosphingobium beihaiensis]|uniref:DegT/DnrJ/EryC1/StrS family aminotransferase n=1 Tax=Novosphingobium beihaiensis TaxID=2930389 RepID=A0ABT0BSS5_9SPHN|nr:DegT/DnrJ/EryC1/StrS family aminotransferase [Novosphingobium beihaiensis]MCJ2188105.1 DegT/DnrJ/EryC1/StrS family aminotransferase [Novosphingobium beihaiensis]